MLEHLLHYFMVTCAPAVAGMKSNMKAALEANVCRVAAEEFFNSRNPLKLKASLLAATKKYYDEIGAFAKTKTPSMCCPGPEHGWIDFSAVAEVSGAVPQEAEPLVPKLITYDRAGAPENAQDSRDQGEQEPKWTQLPWKE